MTLGRYESGRPKVGKAEVPDGLSVRERRKLLRSGPMLTPWELARLKALTTKKRARRKPGARCAPRTFPSQSVFIVALRIALGLDARRDRFQDNRGTI